MNRLRLQLIGVLILVALLPALPAAWMTHALIARVLNPILAPEITEGASAGLASTRELLRQDADRVTAEILSGAGGDTLTTREIAALDGREQASLAAIAANAVPPDPDVAGPQIIVPPQPIELGGRPVWATRVVRAGEPAAWIVHPLPAELERRAKLMTGNIRLIETLRRERGAVVRSLVGTFVLVYGAILVLVLLGGLLLASRLARPVTALAHGIRAVASGDLQTRVSATTRGDMGRLVTDFNGMVARLHSQQQQLLRLEKLAAWRQMARSLAHEIKNPLTPIQLAAQQTRDAYRGDDPEYRALVEEGTGIIEEEVTALRNLVTSFSQFARLPEPQMSRVALDEVLTEITGLYGAERVCLSPPASPADPGVTRAHLRCDREQIHRALINLINNAHEAQETVGCPDPIAISSGRDQAGNLTIAIADRGPGVPAADRRRIFEPDFTTKSGGMGLGLAIAEATIAAHGGKLAVHDREGGGAVFTITFPEAAPEENDPDHGTTRAAPDERASSPDRGGER
ncbi:MAG: HAMP domain-containing protein [Candidatus Eisenbacteria sp.]|nr:HAMP domain-containing protein [Candidatus Eisenbacteria bacterium]